MVYQRIKENQREERESVVLAEQIENIKNHIGEVEKLYGDIRGLKHDMGNHISVLENLFMKNEKDEVEKYLSDLKMKWGESDTSIKNGNSVTDVILIQKQKEAEESGIAFNCEFHYPSGTKVEAFDVSVILNNAIENALHGTEGCSNPYVSVISYRKKNAFMIEISNNIQKPIDVNEETGLPESTKSDSQNHGFGLTNIRKVARKYYGDIDIEQKDNVFLLSIMLMIE
ncbi:MAG: ATP-binding protein [Lachnospiraceae bacterium]|nr:ATP-binding protein [Lachnospiraceae bacterium]